MKKLVLLMAAVLFGATNIHAETLEESTTIRSYTYGNSFIFTEGGITFSVYPDGELDFYIDNQVNVGVGARMGNVGITFNSGWDYNPFVQYDDYGAIIQVENVPIFYDYYGRVSQIGDVDVWYRNGRVRRLGSLNVFYNGGAISHYTGFINIYNRRYVYRPFHRWFARPAVGFCNVYTTPYRRYYTPVRYTWYKPYRNNYRRSYAHIGKEYRYNKARRSTIYRNDNRVAVNDRAVRRSSNSGRSNLDYAANRSANRRTPVATNSKSYRNSQRSSTSKANRSNTNSRSNTKVSRGQATNSSNRNDVYRRSSTAQRGNTTTKRTVTKTPNRTTVTKRSVTKAPNSNRTVTKRSTSTYRKPTNNTSSRSYAKRSTTASKSNNSSRSVTKRSTSAVKKSAPGRTSRSSSARSSSARSTTRRMQ